MRYAITSLIVFVLLVNTGCARLESKQIVSKDERYIFELDLSEKSKPFDEVKCRAKAKKWVEEIEKLMAGGFPDQSKASEITRLSTIAALQAKVGDREVALKNFERAKEIVTKDIRKSNRSRTWSSIARFEAEAGFFDCARKTAAKVGAKFKSQTFRSIVTAAIREKNFVQAKRAVADSGNENLYFSIAQAEANAGCYNNAIKTLEFLAASSFSDGVKVTAFRLIAEYAQKSGNKEATEIAIMRAAILLEKSNSIFRKRQCYAELARVQAEAGMLDESMKTLEHVDSRDPQYPALIAIAQSKYASGDKQRAIKLLEQAKKNALALKRQNYDKMVALCMIARVEKTILGEDAAAKTYQKACDINRMITGEYFGPVARLSFCLRFNLRVREVGEEKAIAELRGYWQRANIAQSYAHKGNFEKTHKILRSIDKKSTLTYPNAYKPYSDFLKHIAQIEIKAGVTKYILELAADLAGPSKGKSVEWVLTKILARAGFGGNLEKIYKLNSKVSAQSRYFFCCSAARGYLQCIEDHKRRTP